jgi:putative ABC transport system permease protein
LRTILTMIGIVIGIGAVVAIMSTADSVTKTVSSEIEKTGLNKIAITRNYVGVTPQKLDDSTIHFLRSLGIQGVSGYEGSISVGTQARDYKTGETAEIYLNGATEGNIGDLGLEILAGRGVVTQEENVSFSRVVIVNSDLVKKFFYGDPEAAINELIKIGGSSFKIIGVYKDQSPFSDHLAGVVPLKTLTAEPFNNDGYDQIQVVLDPVGDADSVRIQLMAAMLKARGFTDEKKADFSISSPRQELDTFKQFMTAASAVIALIAAISLVVGGVGIMNIMLVTVSEKTKEIGLMRSLGAKKRDIVKQFLVEAIMLTVFGGVLGVGLGILIAYTAISVINMFDSMPDFLFTVSFVGIAISLGVSILIGLIFGAYPASRAAKLSPVDALRRD